MNLRRVTPKLLTALAVFGVHTTAILAANAAPEAKRRIEEAGAKTFWEKFKACWKCYIPTAASILITDTLILCGYSEMARKNAGLAIGYGASQTALRLYSERATQETRREISAQVMQAQPQPLPAGEVIPLDTTSSPSDQINLCFDYYGGRYFHSSKNQITNAIKEFTEDVLKVNGRGSLNQLYWCFHNPDELPPIEIANLIGWKYREGEDVTPMVTFSPDNNGNPCMIFDFYNPPQYGFDNEFA